MLGLKLSAMKVLAMAGVVGAGSLFAAQPANAAGLHFGISIGLPVVVAQPRAVYVAPAPVYVAPAPIYVAPAPVYVQPAPCVAPAPVVVTVPCVPVYAAPAPVVVVPDRGLWAHDWRGHNFRDFRDFHGFDGNRR